MHNFSLTNLTFTNSGSIFESWSLKIFSCYSKKAPSFWHEMSKVPLRFEVLKQQKKWKRDCTPPSPWSCALAEINCFSRLVALARCAWVLPRTWWKRHHRHPESVVIGLTWATLRPLNGCLRASNLQPNWLFSNDLLFHPPMSIRLLRHIYSSSFWRMAPFSPEGAFFCSLSLSLRKQFEVGM